MQKKGLRKTLTDRSGFAVVAELTGGPRYNFAPIERFLSDYHNADAAAVPDGFDFVGITLPQNPGGVANIEPGDVLAKVQQADLLGDLEVIPHISCKDLNADGLLSSLVGFRERGVRTVLALTGDKPLTAKGVFDLDSVTLLKLVSRLNRDAWLAARPGQWQQVPILTAGAAVSPFKYTEASQMQQYFKMEKKLAAGAAFLITQVGWDWRKSVELMRYLDECRLDAPVVGNVYLLSKATPAARLMHDGDLPGCYVSDRLFETVMNETLEQAVTRAAQQVAMYRAIGAAGVDLGGLPDYGTFVEILNQAAQIGTDWEAHKENLSFGPGEGAFYLYDEQGRRTTTATARRGFRRRWFEMMHRAMLDPEHTGFRALRGTMRAVGAGRGRGVAYRGFHAMERAAKYVLFECEDCGDCYLPENFGYCTLGGCAKGLANSPCGDATVDGHCGNDTEQPCRGEQIYYAAAATPGGMERLRKAIHQPRDPALAHTSSILNYLFGRDHTMGNALISIGEAIHASIPKTGKVMKELVDLGDGAYEKDSGPLSYMRALIEDQAEEGADYIAINVDAFGENDPQLAIDLMVQYVKLVRRWGRGVPVCLDSSDDAVLKAGLAEWYREGTDVPKPLVNSIKVYTADEMMPLKKDYDFAFIGLLVSEDKAQGPGGSHSVEELLALAEELFDKAMQHGFKPDDIFFDSTVFPLAIDMPMEPGVPGYTYRAFETIRRIRSNPKFKGVHCSLGISNCCRDLPGRRIGICRAYVAKAMEHGLDAGIVNVGHHYGRKEVDPGLYELVDAFARMDGSAEATNKAMMLMGRFCAENRKA